MIKSIINCEIGKTYNVCDVNVYEYEDRDYKVNSKLTLLNRYDDGVKIEVENRKHILRNEIAENILVEAEG